MLRIAQIAAVVTLATWLFGIGHRDAWSAGDSDGGALYEAACAACHGSDGRGRSVDQLGFDTPVPDFTDCSFNSREPSADWVGITHEGGPIRGFSQIMPAYGSAFTMRELEAIIRHVKAFCPAPEWPRGELNLPRAMFTEKAYPEDEAVLTFDRGIDRATDSRLRLIWEKRFGARGQVEVIVPYRMANLGAPDHWQHGFGDVAVGAKYAFAHDAAQGYIWAAGGELVLPTGDEAHGFGNDSTAGELYLAFGKVLPADAFVQSRVLIEGQFSGGATREAAWQLALGKTWTSGLFGRSWTPMVELLAARDLESGASTHWDIVPQLQVSLNQRQHLLFSMGVQLPLTDRGSRDSRILAYVLWDWFDGGLRDGW
jgi:mono/diheme cytochrome c family protein